MLRPESPEEAAALLGEAAAEGRKVVPTGSGTKLAWARCDAEDRVPLSSRGLDQIIEHNAGDFTAVVGAGMRLADAQAAFAEAGQMLAWDPPLGPDGAATIGGIVACADSGPLRHRYGAVRDIVIGTTVVLSDGLIAKSGGRVIKNVAGYDLAKLYTGSFGELGLVASVAVRLHPLIRDPATLMLRSSDPVSLTRVALSLARRPLELDSLDLTWQNGEGAILARASGATAQARMEAVASEVGVGGEGNRHSLQGIPGLEAEVILDDEGIWDEQRRAQCSDQGLVIKVSALPTDLLRLMDVADEAGARLTCRASLGLAWLKLAPGDDLAVRGRRVVQRLAPRVCRPLDGADRVDLPAPPVAPALARLNATLQRRFDPLGLFAMEVNDDAG